VSYQYVPVKAELLRRIFSVLVIQDEAGNLGVCEADPCETCSVMEELQAIIPAPDEDEDT
jgi:hypothetical protein